MDIRYQVHLIRIKNKPKIRYNPDYLKQNHNQEDQDIYNQWNNEKKIWKEKKEWLKNISIEEMDALNKIGICSCEHCFRPENLERLPLTLGHLKEFHNWHPENFKIPFERKRLIEIIHWDE